MKSEKEIDRELHQSTLRRMTELSGHREETGEVFKVTTQAVSVHVDEIEIEHQNGVVKYEYIEEGKA